MRRNNVFNDLKGELSRTRQQADEIQKTLTDAQSERDKLGTELVKVRKDYDTQLKITAQTEETRQELALELQVPFLKWTLQVGDQRIYQDYHIKIFQKTRK